MIANEQPLVKVLHHLRGDSFVSAVPALTADFGADAQSRQNLQAGSDISLIPQDANESLNQGRLVLVVARARHGDDGQKAMIHQLADAVHGPVESAVPTNRVVVLRG